MANEYNSRSERREHEEEEHRHQEATGAATANANGSGPKKPRHKKSPWRWLLYLLILIVIALFVFGGMLYAKSKGAVDSSYKPSNIKKARDVDQVLKDGKPFSVLLLGTDTGEFGRDYKGRTDSMMLVTVNPKEEKTTIMSIPRDSLVAVPGHESEFPSKINAAYEYGSSAATIKTVQDWLNVPIDFYALVNMGGLEKVVDQVGGIEVTSPLTFDFNPETAHSEGDNLYHFTKGSSTFTHTKNGKTTTSNTMNGDYSLAFSRMRYADPNGDYGRQERQRLVMQGILDKIKQNPTKVLSSNFIEEIGKSTQTDMTFGDVMKVGTKYISAANNIESDHIQGNGYNLSSGSTEVVYRGEQQRATDVLRKSLDLNPKQTGNLYSGDVSDETIIANGVPTLAQSEALSNKDGDTADIAPQTDGVATGSAGGTASN